MSLSYDINVMSHCPVTGNSVPSHHEEVLLRNHKEKYNVSMPMDSTEWEKNIVTLFFT